MQAKELLSAKLQSKPGLSAEVCDLLTCIQAVQQGMICSSQEARQKQHLRQTAQLHRQACCCVFG